MLRLVHYGLPLKGSASQQSPVLYLLITFQIHINVLVLIFKSFKRIEPHLPQQVIHSIPIMFVALKGEEAGKGA